MAGAKYVLNVGFKPGALVFINETEAEMYGAPPALTCAKSTSEVRLRMNLVSKVAKMWLSA